MTLYSGSRVLDKCYAEALELSPKTGRRFLGMAFV